MNHLLRPVDRRWFRILAFDGGPTVGPMLMHLKYIVQDCPDFFSKVQLFAGTSGGSFNALYLASKTDEELRDGPRIVDELLAVQETLCRCLNIPNPIVDVGNFLKDPSLDGFGSMLKRLPRDSATFVSRLGIFASGFGTLLKGSTFEQFAQETFTHKSGPKKGQMITFEELPQKVAVVSFDLMGREFTEQSVVEHLIREREKIPVSWGPRLYHNLVEEVIPPEIASLKAYDIAVRSSSLPMFLPTQVANVDGAVFANNPSMCALSIVLESLSNYTMLQANKETPKNPSDLWRFSGVEDILLFSVGGGDQDFVDPDQAHRDHRKLKESGKEGYSSQVPWGYWKWALTPKDPFRVLKLMFNAGDNGVSGHCESIMGRGNFYRFTLSTPGGSIRSMIDLLLGDVDELYRVSRENAAEWQGQSSWQDALLALLDAGGLLAPEIEPQGPVLHAPFDPVEVLGLMEPEWKLPQELIDFMHDPFNPDLVLFPREKCRVLLREALPDASDESIELRLHMFAGYLFIGIRISQFLNRAIPMQLAQVGLLEPETLLSLLIQEVYRSLNVEGMSEGAFAVHAGDVILALWEQLKQTYQHESLNVPLSTTTLWLLFVWLLDNEKKADEMTIRPLWDLLTQRTPYGGMESSVPAFMILFRNAGANYRSFLRAQGAES
jgi:hypothetical protein